jgi:hypothetical protein
VIYLKEGDAEPKVCAVQVLLNRCGQNIEVDGYFGPRTRQAVGEFQQQHDLTADGKVEAATWARLVDGSRLVVIDALDVTDMVPNDKGKIRNATRPFLTGLPATGSQPIVTGAACRGGGRVFDQILHRSAGYEAIVLLRFFGHGYPAQVMLSGIDGLTLENFEASKPALSRIRPRLGRFASVEMHSCRVAATADGRLFLNRLAAFLGVPVTAAVNVQYSSDRPEAAVRFQGPTFTAYPRCGGLKEWAKQFTAVSV